MEHDTLFISHSSVDSELAKRLASDLKKQGVRVWLDVLDIEPGADWNSSIQEAIKRSSQLVVIWSQNSVVSTEVLTEAIQAREQGKQILQIMIDGCQRPSLFDMYQNIDFRQNYDEGLQRLVGFLPSGRRKQRLRELAGILPSNPYPRVPRIVKP